MAPSAVRRMVPPGPRTLLAMPNASATSTAKPSKTSVTRRRRGLTARTPGGGAPARGARPVGGVAPAEAPGLPARGPPARGGPEGGGPEGGGPGRDGVTLARNRALLSRRSLPTGQVNPQRSPSVPYFSHELGPAHSSLVKKYGTPPRRSQPAHRVWHTENGRDSALQIPELRSGELKGTRSLGAASLRPASCSVPDRGAPAGSRALKTLQPSGAVLASFARFGHSSMGSPNHAGALLSSRECAIMAPGGLAADWR